MGVNAAALIHHARLGQKTEISGFIVPALGLLICGFIWIHVSRPALILGAFWMAAGITYGGFRTSGFRSDLVTLGAPPDLD
jgi:putrescine importer